jgi:succinate dehydrogenase / fumarate reductase iron-sulfur subunit
MTTQETTMDVTLRVWRQKGPDEPGRFVTYEAKGVTPDMSFF